MNRSAMPTATYRLQLHKDFNFAHAAEQVPYLTQLGISHLYLSPILTARAGSLHGYDVVDHSRINPELGGEPGLLALAASCHEAGLGIIVDIVPNHMAIGGANNPLWLDMLENGEASAAAKFFDIDFTSSDAAFAGKIVVPFLGEPYDQALTKGKLTLVWDPILGKLAAAYGPHRFPIRRDHYGQVAGAMPPGQADLSRWQQPALLHDLLERQHFRLVWWRTAGDTLNWRRFFDVNELASLRMEDQSVFQSVHAVIFRLYAQGIIDGVRVDHIDGLADPAAYMRALHSNLARRNEHRPPGSPSDGPYIIIEKILGHDEQLPADWPTQGTSGYDFMDQVNALQHDPNGALALTALWDSVAGNKEPFEAIETAARREILQTAFAGQLVSAARAFETLARADLVTRDLTAESFRRVIVAFVAHLRVYRSYATGRPDAPSLTAALQIALQSARAALPADAASIDFIWQVLAGEATGAEETRRHAVCHLNQLTAPVAAKAVEDTAFYRYGRLLSRNDVGFNAATLALDTASFIRTGQHRAEIWPHAMLTTATHDHKRGEDVRARLAVLSELPEAWQAEVQSWFSLTAAHRPRTVSPADAYMLFQTLVGAWPIGLTNTDAAGLHGFRQRVAAWREKSLREAKLQTSWAAPDAAFEAAHQAWLADLLDPAGSPEFLRSLGAFVDLIAGAGAINGVVQAALRCTWPGVPDLYQGAELWDFSLVDPDNRRPVDYAQRRQLLHAQATDWRSGAAKQSIIAHLLAWRRAQPNLFTHGSLHTVPVRGRRAAHVLAFVRAHGPHTASIAVMLRVARSGVTLGDLPPEPWWADTEVHIGNAWRRAAALFVKTPVFTDCNWIDDGS
jgi:(1->4)-alpha-D-glucan 1-alpha-D-glucosylmutase